MLERRSCWCLALMAALVASTIEAAPPDREWEMIWSDEFDSASLDSSRWGWGSLPWGGIHHNDQYASYITSADSYLSGGNLVLRCRKVGQTVNGTWVPWTEGFVHSNTKFRVTYGYAEIRAQFAVNKGTWPAFWMLSDGWPPEIDVAELFGTEYYMHHGLYTGSWDSTHSTADGTWNWHTWGIEWGPGFLRWWKDGAVMKTITGLKVPDQSMYFILNSGMRSSYDSSTPDPNYTQVDYIRVYRRTENVLNGDFEQYTSADNWRALPWWKWNDAIPNTGSGRGGSVSLRLTTTTVGASNEQSVYGLLPNTPYALVGWGRSETSSPTAQVRIGVKNFGGTETAVAVSGTNWGQAVTLFTTGAANDTARVYAYLPTLSSRAYADDLELHRAGVANDTGFEQRYAWPWDFSANVFTHDWGGDYCRGGRYAMRFNQNTSSRSAEQTVYGLNSNTTYRLTCWLRTHNQAVRLGVKNHGLAETYASLTGMNWTWTKHTHTFTTGATNTSARLFALIPSGSNNQVVDLDDFLLVEPLATNWTAFSVGTNGLTGESGMLGSRFFLRGGGENVFNTADTFHFVAREFPGDGSLTARLASFDATETRAKAGVMLRANTNASAAHAMVHWLPDGHVEFIWRTNAGAVADYVWAANAVPWPPWLRLSRTNNSITAAYSTNGTTWLTVGAPQVIALPTYALAGLAVCAHDAADTAEAVFSSVALSLVDSDQDGIPDSWELAQFGNLPIATATSDFDGDGFTDYQEWLCGLNPKVKDALHITRISNLGAGQVQIEFYGVPGVNYPVEGSPSLLVGSWTELVGVSRTTDPNDKLGGLVKHRYAVPAIPGAARFLRVRLN